MDCGIIQKTNNNNKCFANFNKINLNYYTRVQLWIILIVNNKWPDFFVYKK